MYSGEAYFKDISEALKLGVYKVHIRLQKTPHFVPRHHSGG